MTETLKAPFIYFGGKARAADLVWSRLGDVSNFCEPFAGSLAVLLRRPHEGQIETVNDLSNFIANFWRAIKADPEAVAYWADGPVNECDLHSRHAWLVNSRKCRAAMERVRRDPDYFNAKVAGYWCHGACMWIGSGWCETESNQTPRLSAPNGQGVLQMKRPRAPWDENGYMPGVLNNHRPQLADAYSRGRGVHGNDALTQCEARRLWLIDWFTRLADRLRSVRVCCGHWSRICDSDSTLTRLGLTGVFLDPPYRKTLADGTKNRDGNLYANDSTQCVDSLCDEVQAWCLKWAGPMVRVAVCGLEGEYPELDKAGWGKVPWKSRGGYGNRTERGKENAARERLWFSPSCLKPGDDLNLFTRTIGGVA